MQKSNNKIVAFDIETIPDYDVLAQLQPPDVKTGNIKDPDKIQTKIDDAIKERTAKAALNPHQNIICLFSWCDGETADGIVLDDASAKAERQLLLGVWEVLARYDHFVSFNGNSFDIPILNLHSLFNRVRPSVNISIKKYAVTNHTDLRAVLGNWDAYAPGNLNFYLNRCLGRTKGAGSESSPHMDGSYVQHLWDCDLKDEIKTYGVQDARDTFDLYIHAREYYPGLF